MEIVFGTQSFSQSEMRVLSINLSRLLISSQTAQPKGGTLPLLRWNGDIRGRGNGVGRERMSGTFGFMRRADDCRYIRSPSRKQWYSAFISITLTNYWMKRTMVTISVDMDRNRDQTKASRKKWERRPHSSFFHCSGEGEGEGALSADFHIKCVWWLAVFNTVGWLTLFNGVWIH